MQTALLDVQKSSKNLLDFWNSNLNIKQSSQQFALEAHPMNTSWVVWDCLSLAGRKCDFLETMSWYCADLVQAPYGGMRSAPDEGSIATCG